MRRDPAGTTGSLEPSDWPSRVRISPRCRPHCSGTGAICASRTIPALTRALREFDRVVPVFVLDDALRGGRFASAPREAFMLGCLRALDRGLRERGSGLVIRHGRPERELVALAQEAGAEAVLWTSDVSPYARARDERVTHALRGRRRAGRAAGRQLRRRRLRPRTQGGNAVRRVHAVLQAVAGDRAPHRAPRAGRSCRRCRARCARAACPRRPIAASWPSRTASRANQPPATRSRPGSTGRSTRTPSGTTTSHATARAGCRRTCAGAACRRRSASSARRAVAARARRPGSASSAGASSTPTSCC